MNRPYIVDKASLIEEAKHFFKEKGFKKEKNTWLKEKGQLIQGFNVQTSYYNSEQYYINVGIIVVGIDDTVKKA